MKLERRCALSMLLAILLTMLVSMPCYADLIDPDTGEYHGGPVVTEPEPIDDPVVVPDPDQKADIEPGSTTSLLGVGAVVAVVAAGAAVAIVWLGRGKRAAA